MNRLNLEVYLNRADYGRSIDMQLGDRVSSHVALPIEFKEYKEGQYTPPCASFSIDTAQQMMDQLWICGIRPTEGTGSAGSLKATQDHLEDMRKLAFHKIMRQQP